MERTYGSATPMLQSYLLSDLYDDFDEGSIKLGGTIYVECGWAEEDQGTSLGTCCISQSILTVTSKPAGETRWVQNNCTDRTKGRVAAGIVAHSDMLKDPSVSKPCALHREFTLKLDVAISKC